MDLPAGLIAAIIIVLELPPKLSFNNQVRTESRYGIKIARFWALLSTDDSANADITEPNVTSDLFIWAPSFKRCPVAPVVSALSLPAKSTK